MRVCGCAEAVCAWPRSMDALHRRQVRWSATGGRPVCGIAGFVEYGGSINRDELHARATGMATSLLHRGPDDAGTWTDEQVQVALSFRRLSIIDLSSAGAQPMVSSDGRYVLVFN